MNEPNNKCQRCRWYEQCKEMTNLDTLGCDDYDPMDDSLAEEAYEYDLAEREKAYFEQMHEYSNELSDCALD